MLSEYDNKIENLKALKSSNALSDVEYKAEKKQLDTIYESKQNSMLEGFIVEDLEDHKSQLLFKLEQAYHDKSLTQEMYEAKKKELMD